MKLKPLKRVPVLVASAVVVLICLLRLAQPDFFERLECMTYDMRVRAALRLPAPIATNLGFVFINEESVRKVWDGSLGYRFGLYWPRQVYGRVVDELHEEGARTIAFDVIFGELRPDHSPVKMADDEFKESDEYLALHMNRASNVIIAVTQDRMPPDLLLTNAAAAGDISTDKDPEGILRRAKAFRTYREWHPAFRQAEADPGYGIDLRTARVEPGRIVLPRRHAEDVLVPLNEKGEFALADFFGEALPPGLAPFAKPFADQRVWHMGVVLAAIPLGLDLDNADVNLRRGYIRLKGPAGVERILPVDEHGYFYIDWSLPPNHPSLTQEGVHELLARNRARLRGEPILPGARWAGKLVVIGSAAIVGNDLTDRGATPISRDTLLVSKHWNVANSILMDRFVRRAPLWLDLALIILLGGVSALVTWQMRILSASGVVAGLGVAYVAVALAAYVQYRFWLPLVYPVICALAAEHVTLLTWRVVFEQKEQRRVRSVFSTIVSPKIVNELLQAESLSLGGARREVTVMFADVRGFTELTDAGQDRVAEFVSKNGLLGAAAEACFDEHAREILSTVNLYLGLVADVVIAQDGTLDKFIGDCVMAFWGAPAPNAAHAVRCVRAAVEAQRAIQRLNEQRQGENLRRERENPARIAAGLQPEPPLPCLVLGTGINTGMVTVGLMGSVDKVRNYTVFGREVNLASRLEGQSGRGRIFISEATHEHLKRDDPALAATCVRLPAVTLKGIRSAVNVFEVPWQENSAGAVIPASGQIPSAAAVAG